MVKNFSRKKNIIREVTDELNISNTIMWNIIKKYRETRKKREEKKSSGRPQLVPE